MEEIADLISKLDNFAGYVAVIVVVIQALKRLLEISGTLVQVLTFIIAFGIGFLASLLNVGIFEYLHGELQQSWWVVLVIGAFGALSAMGASSVKKLQDVLDAILSLLGVKIPLKK